MSYIGTQPNNVKKNIGLYNPNEILQLTKEGSWGGSLELIQSQTISSGSTMAFTSIKESKYDVHFLQAKNCESSSLNTSISVRLSNDGGSTYEAGTSYELAMNYGTTGGSFGEVSSTGLGYLEFLSDSQSQNRGGYMYLYQLGNSSKYSFSTFQGQEETTFTYGGGLYDTAETINAIQVLTTNGNAWTGTVELYGCKQL
jgi:hypothetical protein